MKKQHLKIMIMTTIICAFFALIGTTYAYFQVRIIENQNKTSIDVTSKILEVTYKDGHAEFSGSDNGYIFPGQTVTKYFTVENTGDDIASFNIVLKNIENTFSRKQDWTYQLGTVSDTNLDGVINNLDQINYFDNPKEFPGTNEKVTIMKNLSVAYNSSINFVLKVEYANSNEDQSTDMNRTLNATVDIDYYLKDTSE